MYKSNRVGGFPLYLECFLLLILRKDRAEKSQECCDGCYYKTVF